jgi:hypothetical protein
MNLTIRIPKSILSLAKQDLARPHSFAYERVGFLRCRPTGRSDLIVVTGYDAVPDNQYIDNPEVGACIGGEAIRLAMQRILTDNVGIIHIHQHEHAGVPSPSPIDLKSQPRLVDSCRRLNPQLPHGFMILSNTHAWGAFSLPSRERLIKLTTISVVSERVEFI